MSTSSDRFGCDVNRTVGPRGQNTAPSPGSPSSVQDTLSEAAPLTSVDITHSPQRVLRVEQGGGQLAVVIEPAILCKIFGVSDAGVATRLLSQLINVIQPDHSKPVDTAALDQILALIEGIGPTNTLEALTSTMLVGAQHAALDSLRRAAHPDQAPVGRQSYTALSLKAMRTCANLVESLYVGRGKAVRQEINVTHAHVTLEAGAQAMVGTIDASRGRG